MKILDLSKHHSLPLTDCGCWACFCSKYPNQQVKIREKHTASRHNMTHVYERIICQFFQTGIWIGSTQTFRLNKFYDSNTKTQASFSLLIRDKTHSVPLIISSERLWIILKEVNGAFCKKAKQQQKTM